ncbi:MAG: hypothetical protein ACJ74E_09320, partial [Actinomycetes bacterium]
MDDHAPGLVKRRRQRYMPITSPVQSDLVTIVRGELRPEPIRQSCPSRGLRLYAETFGGSSKPSSPAIWLCLEHDALVDEFLGC